ncbi:hypothetical protein GGR50DRAFT_643002 [Xylaria sp. CBS 124048]|nr:hypothetical protein GGR50DRAFT_643002 [Xylaria sp. CBS 124048]
MQFTVLLALTALATGINAAAFPRQPANPRLAQFRIFGKQGCSAENDGFYTVDKSDVGNCGTLVDEVSSVHLELLNSPAADGCSVRVFTSDNCSAGSTATAVKACTNAKAGETFKSWKITC